MIKYLVWAITLPFAMWSALQMTTSFVPNNNHKPVGYFEAEGKKINTRFVRVLYAGEGSEEGTTNNSVNQVVYDSKDPKGKAVKAYRFQVVTKNTGYDEVQTSQEEDYKLKNVTEGAKIHIEVPVENGKLQLNKAYIGNLAYNFGTRETRNILAAHAVDNIKLDLIKLDLPDFGPDSKPGDKGLKYNEGYINLRLRSKAKYIDTDKTGDFNINIDGVISVVHVRGKEREDRAVTIDQQIVAKNK